MRAFATKTWNAPPFTEVPDSLRRCGASRHTAPTWRVRSKLGVLLAGAACRTPLIAFRPHKFKADARSPICAGPNSLCCYVRSLSHPHEDRYDSEHSCSSNFPRASQSISFIRPSIAISAAVPPRGTGWLHEIMIDGFRVQLHKSARRATIYGADGHNLTAYLPQLRQNLLTLPVKSAVIDAVLVARSGNIKLKYDAFLAKAHTQCCCWCFDLLECDGVNLRPSPLIRRKDRLKTLICDDHLFRYCSEIRNPGKALAVSERIGCAGVISKRIDQPYRSGRNSDWVEVASGPPRMQVVSREPSVSRPRTISVQRSASRR